MLDIDLKTGQTLLLNSEQFSVKKGHKYSISTDLVGIKGQPHSAYFGVIFLDNNNKEIDRKIRWLNNFSNKLTKLDLVFEAVTSKIIFIYRINSETPSQGQCHFKLTPLEKINFKEEANSVPENFDHIDEWSKNQKYKLTTKEEDKLEKNLVWVFGYARSGTTWLALQLLSHNTKSINELHIASHLSLREEGITDNIVRRIDHMKNLPSYFFSDKYKDTWKFFMRKLILNRIYAEVGELNKKIILKEPGGEVGAPDIITQCLPNSKIVVLLRDGRDIIDSLIDAKQKDGFITKSGETPVIEHTRKIEIEKHSKIWSKYVEKLLDTYNNYPEELRLLIKYEDLLKNTFEELKKLHIFIENNISDEKILQLISKFSFENIPIYQKGKGKFARSASPGKWKTSFTDAEKRIMHENMNSSLRKLGYE